MHDLRYSVSFQVKIFVLCYLGHFHLDCANFPIQTDFVPKIMNLNLGVILRQLYNSKYRCVGWFSGKMLRPLTTQQRVRSPRSTFVNKRLSGL